MRKDIKINKHTKSGEEEKDWCTEERGLPPIFSKGLDKVQTGWEGIWTATPTTAVEAKEPVTPPGTLKRGKQPLPPLSLSKKAGGQAKKAIP